MMLLVKWIGIGRIIDMKKITEVLILKKKIELEKLNFISLKNKDNQYWNTYPYSDEQHLISHGESCYSITKEYNWQDMKYMIATPTDVRDQCYACGIRPQLTSKLKPIVVGDLIVRNGRSVNFHSYHVPCAINIIKEVSNKLLQTLERNKILDPILYEQEMRKNEA